MLNVFPVLYPYRRRMDGGESTWISWTSIGATQKDEYPMLVAETLINAAAGNKILSFMDGNVGYNQISWLQKTYTRLHSEYLVSLDCSNTWSGPLG
jgi:hypothetical protein